MVPIRYVVPIARFRSSFISPIFGNRCSCLERAEAVPSGSLLVDLDPDGIETVLLELPSAELIRLAHAASPLS